MVLDVSLSEKEKRREYHKLYREKNAERLKAQKSEYYFKNKDGKIKDYKEKNAEIRKKKRKEYVNNNKDSIKTYNEEYRIKNREKINKKSKAGYWNNVEEKRKDALNRYHKDRENKMKMMAEWKRKNPDKIKNYSRKYYDENSEEIREYMKEYALLNFPSFFKKIYDENKNDFQKIIYSNKTTQRKYGFLTFLEFENEFPICCDKCGEDKVLQIHHRIYRYPIMREDIMFLCSSCHYFQNKIDIKLRREMLNG